MRLVYDRLDRLLASGSWWLGAIGTTAMLSLGIALDVKEPWLLPFLLTLFSFAMLPAFGFALRAIRSGARVASPDLVARFGRFGVTRDGQVLRGEERAEPPSPVRLPKLAPKRLRLSLSVAAAVASVLFLCLSVFDVIGLDKLIPLMTYASVLSALWSPVLFRRSAEIVVGRDGVRVGAIYLPYESEDFAGHVVMLLGGGLLEQTHVPIDRSLATALSKLAQALANEEGVDGDLFARKEREDDVSWRRRVSTLLTAGDFREAAPTVELAKSVVRSPRATTRARVGAMIALSAREPAAASELLLECADPELEKELASEA